MSLTCYVIVSSLLLVTLPRESDGAQGPLINSHMKPVDYEAKVLYGDGEDSCPDEPQEVRVQNTIEEQIRTVLRNRVVPALQCYLGQCEGNPASSCKEIAQENLPSGYYWIRKCSGTTVRVYCEMNPPCCNNGTETGWMRAGFINMTDDTQQCPHDFRLVVSPKRTCEKALPSTCATTYFNTYTVPYTRVCGRVIGYQDRSPDGFYQFYQDQTLTIDDNYLDGISITHGHSPRKHIWTFVAALHEVTSDVNTCPCTKTDTPYSGVVPPFIGNDYFCDSGSRNNFEFRFYPDDPLWDGQGCGPTSECCTFNNPPWFCKELPEVSTDDIELRNCGDQHLGDEDIAIELVELYVQ